MVTIVLTSEDRFYATKIVDGRNTWKRQAGIPKPKEFGGKSKVDNDYHGALAEIAVCKFLGLPLSEVKIIPPHDKDIGYDLMYKGKKIEVKYTYYENGHLIHRPFRPIVADYYILAVGNENSMKLKGYCTGEEMKNAELQNFGYAHCSAYSISQDQLHNVEMLKDNSHIGGLDPHGHRATR